jgi:spore germination cell wall hydrolase CwlJ-like protein
MSHRLYLFLSFVKLAHPGHFRWRTQSGSKENELKNSNMLVQQISNAVLKIGGFLAVAFVVISVTNTKLSQLREQVEEQSPAAVSVAERTRQLNCLTKNIYWEAGSEPFEGKVAVAQVTLNRVESGRFAPDICGVVYQKNVIYEKLVCQFSWYCDGSSKVKPIHPTRWRESEEVAKQVLFEGFRLPSLRSALYFHADYINPKWGKPQVAKIGRHVFYSERKI